MPCPAVAKSQAACTGCGANCYGNQDRHSPCYFNHEAAWLQVCSAGSGRNRNHREAAMINLQNKQVVVVGAADGVPAASIADALRQSGGRVALLINQYFV